MVCTILGSLGVTCFAAPDGQAFKGVGGKTCLPAYYKLNKGWLSPLPQSLAFVGALLALCFRGREAADLLGPPGGLPELSTCFCTQTIRSDAGTWPVELSAAQRIMCWHCLVRLCAHGHGRLGSPGHQHAHCHCLALAPSLAPHDAQRTCAQKHCANNRTMHTNSHFKCSLLTPIRMPATHAKYCQCRMITPPTLCRPEVLVARALRSPRRRYARRAQRPPHL